MQVGKTLHFEGTTLLIKKAGGEDFDVPIGCFYRAEIYESIGSCIQSNLTNIICKEDVGLYRDDSLDIFENISRSEIETRKSYH